MLVNCDTEDSSAQAYPICGRVYVLSNGWLSLCLNYHTNSSSALICYSWQSSSELWMQCRRRM